MKIKETNQETFTKVHSGIMRIPRHILNGDEKILLAKIVELNALPQGCFATNASFADSLGSSAAYISSKVSKLEKLEYISRKTVYHDKTKQVLKRILTPTFKWKGMVWNEQSENAETVLQDCGELLSYYEVTKDGEIEASGSMAVQESIESKQEVSSEVGIGYPEDIGEVSSEVGIGYPEDMGEVSSEVGRVIDNIKYKVKENEIELEIDNAIEQQKNTETDTGNENDVQKEMDQLIYQINDALQFSRNSQFIWELLFIGKYKELDWYIPESVKIRIIPLAERYIFLCENN